MSTGLDEFAEELECLRVGYIVDSFGCEPERPYMPGTGMIIAIRPKDERPFICRHNGINYSFKASEIERSDCG